MTRAREIGDDTALLTDLWYFAAPARDVRPGAMIRKILFDEPILLGRTISGKAFALRDVCPHRGAPLSSGRLVEDLVECPYHGWRYRAADGGCAAIPALASDDPFDPSKIHVQRFALHEANGLLWIFWPGAFRGEESQPAPPDIGLAEKFHPMIVARAQAEGPYDEAVIGLVDPAHTPFVHRQWWWREGAGLKDKKKTFAPSALGFTMTAHRPSSNSRIYKILGGAPTTEIEFRLPGVRLEMIKTAKRTILGLTAITPTEEGKADVTHVIFWDRALLSLAQPIIQQMASNFLAQDGAILRAQNRNLSRIDHRPLYVGDPDEPAKWYLRLKRAWAGRAPGAPFENPIAGGELRWRT